MIRFKDISIPKPCSVDYDSLPGNEVKRYCDSCEKNVYDFRGKDEIYLNNVFELTGKVCGIYYEDQIQKSSLKIQRPLYYRLLTKAIGIGLFLKTILNTHDTTASNITKPQTSQKPIDSSGVKVHYKEKNIHHNTHHIEVFVNNQLYEYELKREDSILYLPNSIQPNDNIKIIVRKSKRKLNYSRVKIKAREYSFKFQNLESITIDISCNRKLLLFKKKRPQVVGRLRAL
jgi:hypothetical protein